MKALLTLTFLFFSTAYAESGAKLPGSFKLIDIGNTHLMKVEKSFKRTFKSGVKSLYFHDGRLLNKKKMNGFEDIRKQIDFSKPFCELESTEKGITKFETWKGREYIVPGVFPVSIYTRTIDDHAGNQLILETVSIELLKFRKVKRVLHCSAPIDKSLDDLTNKVLDEISGGVLSFRNNLDLD